MKQLLTLSQMPLRFTLPVATEAQLRKVLINYIAFPLVYAGAATFLLACTAMWFDWAVLQHIYLVIGFDGWLRLAAQCSPIAGGGTFLPISMVVTTVLLTIKLSWCLLALRD